MKLRNIIILFGVLFGAYTLFGQSIDYPQLPTSFNDVKGTMQAKLPAVNYELTDNSISIPNLLEETNKQRANAGLPELMLDTRLNSSATNKCSHHEKNNYWAHDDPNSSTIWESFFIEIAYETAGENLAHGFYTAKHVTQGWMNSQTHRDNLLNPKFNNVGFGVCEDEKLKTIVVQHFIGV